MTALEEFRRRRTAETINRNLKAAQAEKKYVFTKPPTARAALAPQDKTLMPIEQLAQAVPQLYSLSETVFSNKVMTSFGCRMESSVDESRGRIIELVARVPADCSMKQVSDILWQDVKNLSRSPDKSYRYMNERGPDAVAKSFDLAIRCPGDTTASRYRILAQV
ncbi:hypothetical protein PInf_018523 [Phytophthora infestans]|nr:hypothetical protein PInf_018523 [Phytophthora infestans]